MLPTCVHSVWSLQEFLVAAPIPLLTNHAELYTVFCIPFILFVAFPSALSPHTLEGKSSTPFPLYPILFQEHEYLCLLRGGSHSYGSLRLTPSDLSPNTTPL